MEEGQTTQWPKEVGQTTQWPKDRRTDNTMAKRQKKDKTTNNYLQNTTHKTISKNCGKYPLYQLHFLINVSTFNTIYKA